MYISRRETCDNREKNTTLIIMPCTGVLVIHLPSCFHVIISGKKILQSIHNHVI